MRALTRFGRGSALAALVALITAALLTSGCAPGADELADSSDPGPSFTPRGAKVSASPLPTPTGSDAPRTPLPWTLAVVGDSNSTGFTGSLDRGIAAGATWMSFLPPEQFVFAGGWAMDGATTSVMADSVFPVAGAQIVVVMGGTNDLGLGVPEATTLAELGRIAERVAAPRVALAAIAPMDPSPEAALELNAAMERFARANGWFFIDPWATVRNADGTWLAEYRTDGIHTSVEGYAAAASQISLQLKELLQ